MQAHETKHEAQQFFFLAAWRQVGRKGFYFPSPVSVMPDRRPVVVRNSPTTNALF